MKRFSKILFLLILLSIIRLSQSCKVDDFTYNSNTIEFKYNKIKIQNIDNSGIYSRYLSTDTMYNGAVTFKISVMDSTNKFTSAKPYASFGFSTLTAKTENEPPTMPYKPKYKIQKLNIITMESISQSLPANTDITNHFVYYSENFKLYKSRDELLSYFNASFESDTTDFQISLKDKIQNNRAQFLIIITLSDGQELRANTKLIHLITTAYNE